MTTATTTGYNPLLVDRFRDRARAAGARVLEISDFAQAAIYAASLAAQSTPQLLAAPALSPMAWDSLRQKATEKGVTCVKTGLRDYLKGIGTALTLCDFGIAETGTIVLHCPDEELRLATMISDIHICVLRTSQLVTDGQAIEAELSASFMLGRNYTAFITGPSRTADIERVLAIGVHGPLELHILLMEDSNAET